MHWQTTRFKIDLSHPRVMGIVNVTPDSFSDGGLHNTTASALRHCEDLLKQGADLLDIGGESTRPGAQALPLAEELSRVLPVVREAVRLGVPISIDTYKPRVMQAVLDLGADIINDIWALRWQDPADPLAACSVVTDHAHCGICLMHMHGEPQTMQIRPMEGEPIPVVKQFLQASAQRLLASGVASSRVVLDPGIGFGKSVEQNFKLLAQQAELLDLGYPLLLGWSRKSSLAALTGPPQDGPGYPGMHPLLPASLAAAVLAVQRGAAIVRVHDVLPTVQALKVLQALN
ncbi:MAG: dihydropteroate synthase [Hylemonella sp.]